MAESQLRELSVDFAVGVLKLSDTVRSHPALINQLEKAATSIGANIHEANYAQSKADFISKLQIALKECYETEYWLELLTKSDIVDKGIIKNFYDKCGKIRRLLIASINTAKTGE